MQVTSLLMCSCFRPINKDLMLTHSAFVPLLCCWLPLYDELMKCLLTFTRKCINCELIQVYYNKLVNVVARYAVWYGCMASPLGCSVFWCCSKYDFEYEDFMSSNHQYILGYYRSMVSDEAVVRVQILLELLFIRSGVYQLDNFSVSDVKVLIYSVCTCK